MPPKRLGQNSISVVEMGELASQDSSGEGTTQFNGFGFDSIFNDHLGMYIFGRIL